MGKLITGLVLLIFWIGLILNYIFSYLNIRPGEVFTREQELEASFTALLTGFFIFAIPGGLLTFFGYRSVRRWPAVIKQAHQLLSEDGKIDSRKLSDKLGIDHSQTREMLAKALRKGKIPVQVEIIW